MQVVLPPVLLPTVKEKAQAPDLKCVAPLCCGESGITFAARGAAAVIPKWGRLHPTR